MRHKRIESSQQRRFIKRLVTQCAFQDRQRSETVNILSREVIVASASRALDLCARLCSFSFCRSEKSLQISIRLYVKC